LYHTFASSFGTFSAPDRITQDGGGRGRRGEIPLKRLEKELEKAEPHRDVAIWVGGSNTKEPTFVPKINSPTGSINLGNSQ
jgi:hypothetical protein